MPDERMMLGDVLPEARHKGWQHLKDSASQADKESRQVAVVRAYSWVSHAFCALGMRRQNAEGGWEPPVAKLMDITFQQGLLGGIQTRDAIRQASDARSAIVDGDADPGPGTTLRAVSTLETVWHDLRARAVNLAGAERVARQVACAPGVRAVLLFGSLARGSRDAGDIDLLVLDDGSCSGDQDDLMDGYLDVQARTDDALEQLGINDSVLNAMATCRWLDVFLLDGTLFGIDAEYTKAIQQAQPDPFFFEHISHDLLAFEGSSGRFSSELPRGFGLLRKILQLCSAMCEGKAVEDMRLQPIDVLLLAQCLQEGGQ